MKKLNRITLIMICMLLLIGGNISAQDDPASTVEAFLEAWNAADYARMYGLLSSQSQEMVAQQAFVNRYQQTQEIVGINEISFTITDTHLQGITAAITYDVVLDSGVFGTIQDSGRIMRVVNEAGRWGVAWSSMDIFAELAGDARFATGGATRRRATIYDRNGEVLVEDGGSVINLWSAQEGMAGVDNCIDLMTRLMRRSRSEFVQRFAQYSPETIFFLGWLDTDTYAQNRNDLVNTCGLEENFSRTSTIRTYYGGNALTAVTGYVGSIPAEALTEYQARGYGAGDQIGLAGVEREYEPVLAGQPERLLRIVEPGGTFTLREFASSAGTNPVPIGLTIDRRLQVIVADALQDAFNYAAPNWASRSTGAGAVVLDVNTGAILAMGSYPTVDPLIFNQNASFIEDRGTYVAAANDISRRPLINRVTQEQFFPGSVYKIITIAAALNEGIVAEDTIFDCQLEWENGPQLGDTIATRYDWRFVNEREPAGEIYPYQALMASCNPFFYEMGARLFRETGGNVLDDYARRMGLGRTYRVNAILDGTAGNLGSPQDVTSAINNAIGQDPVQLPPLGMAVVTAAVANGGTVYDPYLVQQIGGYDGVEVQQTFGAEVLNTLDFNDGVLRIIQQGMCGVPIDTEFGTAEGVFGDASYTLCGKTGTAQAGSAPNAWFVAYSPAENPQIAIVVAVPSSREGSEVAAPIVRRILDDYYNVPRAPFPVWWTEDYNPVDIPEGTTAG
ncbi:MAG: penicillin-binding transpeptidase domain-containing protein [Aggregatilineales bacterium]